MRILLTLLLLMLTISLRGEANDDSKVLIARLQTIALINKSSRFSDRTAKEGIWIEESLQLPGSEKELTDAIQPFLNHSLTQRGLDDLRETIAAYYEDHHRPLVAVVAPPQDVSNGVLKLQILEGTISNIVLRGNKWTSDQFLLSNVKLKTGEQLDSYKLQNNLAWLNRNPFRRTDAFLHPGGRRETTEVELVTVDRFPVRPYVGGDNTGTAFTTRTRWYAGFNAGNLWGVDQMMSYQFTTSQNATSFSAHSGSYVIPFPWKHQLYTYGGWVRLQGDLPQQMRNKGISWQASGRYQIPIFPLFGNFLQEVAIGYDFKQTNNSLQFGGVLVSNDKADTNQFMLSYTLDYHGVQSKTSFIIEAYASPWILTGHQNNEDYNAIRPFAKPRYGYGRGRLSHTYTFKNNCAFKGLLTGQGTAWNLLPSEMFGLGGYDTVRGYEERAFNSDDGVLASVEFLFPSIRMLRGKVKDKLDFLVFCDYGWGKLHRHVLNQKKTQWLMGVGPGLRYSLMTNLYVRADLGFPLHRAGTGRHGIHTHVGATVSY